ncbi:hypothetical protein DN820_12175 [Stutzerimonas nosocomialis]|uniref:Uncharacterized protein n=1 Tax=Stutzerimonas nosocomialis TaxID=1056496 RepID=A0A5R9QDQ8_9GAMM|nr:hypothetical protein DN820_12175 [Stutzerimonas nosocomialis]
MRVGETGGALEADGADLEAALVLDRQRRLQLQFAARQLLQFLETPTLLFEQTLLAVADEVTLTGRRQRAGSDLAGDGLGQRKQHRSEHQLAHRNQSLVWYSGKRAMMALCRDSGNGRASP